VRIAGCRLTFGRALLTVLEVRELKAKGVISDAEFERAKAKLFA
jgi:hypothetical protein